MGKTPIYSKWTWECELPEPFDDDSVNKRRKDVFSQYNYTKAPVATLHGPTLRGIFAYMDIETGRKKGGIGMLGNRTVVEYHANSGEIQIALYDPDSGGIKITCFKPPYNAASAYTLSSGSRTGTAVFLAIMETALKESEFQKQYQELKEWRIQGESLSHSKIESAWILCDNFYRRIMEEKILFDAPYPGIFDMIAQSEISDGTIIPDQILHGRFEMLKPVFRPVKHSDFVDRYSFSQRTFSGQEKDLIPRLPDWYVIPEQAVEICLHIKETTGTQNPMRNFLMRGPAGTGKTEGAKAIAAGLGLPYLSLTCSANTEIYDLLGQIIPEVNNNKVPELPDFQDIQMDPATAYFKMTGSYDENITEEEVFRELVKCMQRKNGAQSFRYVDTPLVQAMRYGYLVELQEPAIISNPGVLVGLNSLLDRCSCVTLPTGEVVARHPDTVVVVTTNSDYEGCKNLNQSVISRMDLVFDVEQPNIETVVERICGITGCTEKKTVFEMAKTVEMIQSQCHDLMILDGCCGMLELIAWVQSYMVSHDLEKSAGFTVLSAVSSDAENRKAIYDTCFAPQLVSLLAG